MANFTGHEHKHASQSNYHHPPPVFYKLFGFLFLLGISSALTITGFAQQTPNRQDREDLEKSASETAEETTATTTATRNKVNPVNAAKSQLKTAQNTIANAALAQRLALLKKRTQNLKIRQAEYHRQITEKGLDPYADLRKRLPKTKLQATQIATTYQHYQSLAFGSPEANATAASLRALLQPVGPYLADAVNPPKFVSSLTPNQVAELKREEAAIDAIKDIEFTENSPELTHLGPDEVFTLLYLPVPLTFRAVPDATVHLLATTGGQFSNGLSAQSVKAGKDGIAHTYWITKGDAVSTCEIEATSNKAYGTEVIRIQVVAPIPKGIPDLPLAVPESVPALK